VAKRDAGAATPAKYFFVSKESLHDAETLFICIKNARNHISDFSLGLYSKMISP
jgi:hypothetical protein